MFKRIAKKQKKREEDEEMGLDDETKAEMGLEDTDSDESTDSESDSETDDEELGGEDDGGGLRTEWLAADADDSEAGTDNEDYLEIDKPPMTINEALKNPIYLASVDPDIQKCVICPGKFIKNRRMLDVHIASGSHKRRSSRFAKTAEVGRYRRNDPREVVARMTREDQRLPETLPDGTSKRALKRKAKIERIKKMRIVKKQMKTKAHRKRDAQRSTDVKGSESGEEGNDEISTVDNATGSKSNRVEKRVASAESPEVRAKKRQKVQKDGGADEGGGIDMKEESPKPKTKKKKDPSLNESSPSHKSSTFKRTETMGSQIPQVDKQLKGNVPASTEGSKLHKSKSKKRRGRTKKKGKDPVVE